MSFPAFNEAWYAEIIERFRHDTESAESVNPALDGIGTAILAGCCILAQAVDGLAAAVREAKGGGE